MLQNCINCEHSCRCLWFVTILISQFFTSLSPWITVTLFQSDILLVEGIKAMFTICEFCLWVEKCLIVRLIKLNTFAADGTDCNWIFVGYSAYLWSDFFSSVEASKGCWCLKFTCPRNIFSDYLPWWCS